MGDLQKGHSLDDVAAVCPLGAEHDRDHVGRLHQGIVEIQKLTGKAKTCQKGLHDRTGDAQKGGAAECLAENSTYFVVSDIVHGLCTSFLLF